jgi:epoxide hydrolase 4
MQYLAPKDFEFEYHEVNGVTLRVGHLGPRSGGKILFLHGFPEFSLGWANQASFFANEGYHVIVPDQRGYNLSSKPASVADYTLTNLTGDIAALIQTFGAEPAIVVGHDWGGGVAWALAQQHPHVIKKLIILNMPHLQVMRDNVRRNPKQMLKSLYAMFFQLPFLPEQLCSAFDFKGLETSMVKTARKGAMSRGYIAACKQAWRQPGALKSMINWYRAFFQIPVNTDIDINVPVLLLWGAKDLFLGKGMAAQSIERCANGKLIMLPKATHWLHHEEPAVVNPHIYDFIKS